MKLVHGIGELDLVGYGRSYAYARWAETLRRAKVKSIPVSKEWAKFSLFLEWFEVGNRLRYDLVPLDLTVGYSFDNVVCMSRGFTRTVCKTVPRCVTPPSVIHRGGRYCLIIGGQTHSTYERVEEAAAESLLQKCVRLKTRLAHEKQLSKADKQRVYDEMFKRLVYQYRGFI